MSNRTLMFAVSGVALALAAGVAIAQAPAAAPAAPAAAAPAAPPAPPFTLTSPTFKDGEAMPLKVGDIRLTNNVNTCGAEAMKVSPGFNWVNVPARATSLVLTMLDVDGFPGAAHFIFYDIPPSKTAIAEGELLDPKTFVAGKNYRNENYSGPCPPATGNPHHYLIQLIATDIPLGTLKPQMTRDEVLAALMGHSVGVGVMIGKYPK